MKVRVPPISRPIVFSEHAANNILVEVNLLSLVAFGKIAEVRYWVSPPHASRTWSMSVLIEHVPAGREFDLLSPVEMPRPSASAAIAIAPASPAHPEDFSEVQNSMTRHNLLLTSHSASSEDHGVSNEAGK
jgi:hypothetical protein